MATVKELHVNGSPRVVNADSERSLLSVLRDDLHLTGSKYGCGEGRCGCCTVLLDGRAVRSCSTPVSTAADTEIQTIEGLAKDGKLHLLQEAFLKQDAMQCGYCTCGMIMSAAALLARDPDSSREDIIRSMNTNICRCGAYPRILAAIQEAARTMKGGKK